MWISREDQDVFSVNIPKIMFNLFRKQKKGGRLSHPIEWTIRYMLNLENVCYIYMLVPASWSRKDRRWGRRGKQTQNSFWPDLCRFFWKSHSAYRYISKSIYLNVSRISMPPPSRLPWVPPTSDSRQLVQPPTPPMAQSAGDLLEKEREGQKKNSPQYQSCYFDLVL